MEKAQKSTIFLWIIIFILFFIIVGFSILIYQNKSFLTAPITGEITQTIEQTSQSNLNEQAKADQEKLNQLSNSCLEEKNCITAITNPTFSRTQINKIKDEEEIIGVYINKIARAYPIKILNWHEAINDTIGDAQILISYSPFCSHTEVYSRKPNQIFEISNKLENNNTVFFEPQSKTYWSQWDGTKIAGASDQSKLEPIKFTRTTFADWKIKYPKTTILNQPESETNIDYNINPFADFIGVPDFYFPMKNSGEKSLNKTLIKFWPTPSTNATQKYTYTDTSTSISNPAQSIAYYGCVKAFHPNLESAVKP